MMMATESDVVQVCISTSDLAFEPDSSETGLDNDVPLSISNMPSIVGYSEMVEALNDLKSYIETERNYAKVFSTLVMCRYFLNGAKRIGVDIDILMAKWHQLKDRVAQ